MIQRILLLLALACPAPAAPILYSNGALNGHAGFFNITTASVTNSFTLGAEAILDTVTFGAWIPSGEFMTDVSWSLSSIAFGSELGSGTLTPASVYQFTPPELGGNFDVLLTSFTLPALDLSAGNYFLTLSNAQTNNGRFAGWDNNAGPSIAFSSSSGSIPSEFFQITGTIVPELNFSQAWQPLLFCCMLLILRRRP